MTTPTDKSALERAIERISNIDPMELSQDFILEINHVLTELSDLRQQLQERDAVIVKLRDALEDTLRFSAPERVQAILRDTTSHSLRVIEAEKLAEYEKDRAHLRSITCGSNKAAQAVFDDARSPKAEGKS